MKIRVLLFCSFLIGCSSLIGQTVLLRELMVAFNGNELSIGIALSSWLLWVGLGSLIAARSVDRIKNKPLTIFLMQLLASIVLIASVMVARIIGTVVGIASGEMMDIPSMIISVSIVLPLFCLLSGYLFTLVVKTMAETSGQASVSVSRVYLAEGLGAGIGGLTAGFLLIERLSAVEIAILIAIFGSIVSGILLVAFDKKRIAFVPASMALLMIIAIAVGGGDRLNIWSSGLRWEGMSLLEDRNSVYGNIVVTEYESQTNFFENGMWIMGSGDRMSAEESVHYPMLEHPNPRSVLLIGGGINGSGNEILKHGVDTLVYVELDPMLIDIARRHLESELVFLDDHRVSLINEDARYSIRKMNERFDVVLVNLPDPLTSMLNRYYSVEFFREVKRILADGGIVSVTLSSSENYLSDEQRGMLRSIYRTMSTVFNEVIALPGLTNFLIATDAKDHRLTTDPDVLIDRLNSRGIENLFVNRYYIPYRITRDRTEYLDQIIRDTVDVRLNRDFHPVGYFYGIGLWSSQFRQRESGSGISKALIGLKLWHLLVMMSAAMLILFWVFRRRSSARPVGVVLSIGTTGFSEISFQVLVILAFQVLYGYVYHRLSVILSTFMLGLVLGSWSVSKWIMNRPGKYRAYRLIQISVCLYPLFLAGVIGVAHRLPMGDQSRWVIQWLFLLTPIVAGFIGGLQFPLASDIIMSVGGSVGRTAGWLYGVDLLGSCVGALITTLILVPIIGVFGTCVVLSVLNLMAIPFLFVYQRRI